MEKNTDRLYTLIITTIIGILFLGGITYGIFQAAHTMLNSQANTTAMRDRTAISKQNVSSDLAAITNANIKFNGKDPITGQKVIKEFTKNGLDYSVNTDTSTVSITGMTNDALSTDSSGHISLTIPKTVTDRQNKSYTVTSIADQAFMNQKIYKATLPDSIVYIGAQAFYNSHLGDLTQDGKFDDITADRYNHGDERNLTIPAKIKFIGREAFADNYLYSITIPNADDLASLDVTATDHNALAYKSADQINTSPVDTKFDKAFVKLQYSSASAYDKRVNSSSAQKYTFISGSYQDYFVIAQQPNKFVNQYHWEGDKLYFYGSNGQPITGFRHYGDNKLEYYGTDHAQYRNRYYHDGDKWYYFGSNGDAITGLRHYGDGKLEFYGADHVQYRNRYATVGNTRYYFGSNGDAVSTN